MRALLSLVLWLVIVDPALTQERFALLIGNQKYSAKVGPLKNPHNDITLIQEALVASGFKENIIVVRDANLKNLQKARLEFLQKLRAAGPDALGFFYYSGHGAAARIDERSNSSANYIIPVDVEDSSGPSEFFESSMKLSDLVQNLREGAPFADLIIVFDACRDELRMNTRSVSTRTFVAEPLGDYKGNTCLGFSSQPNSVAYDSGLGGGPYAKALAEELRKTGQHHEDAFYHVKVAVLAATKRKQNPWHVNNFEKRLYFVPSSQAAPRDDSGEIALWGEVSAANSVESFLKFIEQYPSSSRADDARRRLAAKEEELQWKSASKSGSRSAIESFLSKYSDGPYTATARDHLASMKKAEEDRDWRATKIARSEERILEFLDNYPHSARYDEAREIVALLRSSNKTANVEQTAWEEAQHHDSIPGYTKYLVQRFLDSNHIAGRDFAPATACFRDP